MKYKIYILTLLIITSSYAAEFPKINWKFDIKDNSFGQSAAADLDGDGYLEIAFSTYRNDSCIYVLNSENGSLLWKKNIGGCGDVAPLIEDVDDDGQLDIVVPSSCNPKTFCFNGKTGELKWTANTRGSDSPPVIGDIDGDGKKEILHGEFTGYVICLDAKTGTTKWEILVEENSWIQTAPTICNINDDAFPDFVVASWNFNKISAIYAYSGKDHSLLWKNTEPKSYFYHGTAVADIDSDGKIELLLGCYDGNLYCLNGKDGSTKWKYSDNNFYTPSPVTIADLDKDGKYEIIFSNYLYVTVLKNDGKLFWKYQMKNYGQCFRGVALSDINGDSFLDLAFGDGNGFFYTLNGLNGDTLWTMNLAKEYGDTIDIDHAPLIADFNKDGYNDVFIIGGKANYPNVANNYGRAYMITAGLGKGPEWLMFQYNKERTSFLSNNYLGINQLENSKEFSISPNPAIDFISVSHAGIDPASIEIFNIFGEKEPPRQTSGLTPLLTEGWENKLYVGDLSPGVYFIKIGEKFEKFIKL